VSILGIIVLIGIAFGLFALAPMLGHMMRTMFHHPLITMGVAVVVVTVVAYVSGRL
jgi:uncharacterized membrane protein